MLERPISMKICKPAWKLMVKQIQLKEKKANCFWNWNGDCKWRQIPIVFSRISKGIMARIKRRFNICTIFGHTYIRLVTIVRLSSLTNFLEFLINAQYTTMSIFSRTSTVHWRLDSRYRKDETFQTDRTLFQGNKYNVNACSSLTSFIASKIPS